MQYVPGQAPANLDTDGVRRFTEEELRNIARVVAEGDQAIATNAGAIAANAAAIATNATAIASHEAVWTAYTPTLTTFSGTFTSASAAGRYNTIGKTVFVHVTITITTAGTGTFPVITLPVPPRDINHVVLPGQERQISGFVIVGRPFTGATILVGRYDNSNPAVNGAIMEITGVYEAA